MARPHRFDKTFSKNEREREESRAKINMDRSSQEDREREWARLNLKKGGENGPELCHEVERVKEKGDETIPKKAVRQREQEHKKGEIPEIFHERTRELPKLIPVTKLMYSRARTVA